MNHGMTPTRRPSLRGLPLYALIDPYLGDYPEHGIDLSQCTTFDSLRAIRREAWNGPEVFLAEGDDPVAEVHRLPYIVDLSDADDSLIDKLTADAIAEHQSALEGEIQSYRIGALIETWMAPLDLMLRLQKMWRYRPNMHNFRYLRIADRRVFEALTRLFEPVAIAHWLGPIARWHMLDRGMNWSVIPGEADSENHWYDDAGIGMRHSVSSLRALEAATLNIGPKQHWRLYDSEAVSRALLQWQSSGRVVDEDVYRKAWDGARKASRHGMQEPADKAAFAFRWMRDPDCATRLPVSRALELNIAGEMSFVDALAEYESDIDQPHGRGPTN